MTQSAANSLVYADIGQSSFCHHQSQSTNTRLLDDDAVEYAQLNHNLPIHSKSSKTNIEPAKNSTVFSLSDVSLYQNTRL
jgi:hypothetical protein